MSYQQERQIYQNELVRDRLIDEKLALDTITRNPLRPLSTSQSFGTLLGLAQLGSGTTTDSVDPETPDDFNIIEELKAIDENQWGGVENLVDYIENDILGDTWTTISGIGDDIWTALDGVVGEFTKLWDAANDGDLDDDGIKPGTTGSDNVDAPGSDSYVMLWHIFKIGKDIWSTISGIDSKIWNAIVAIGKDAWEILDDIPSDIWTAIKTIGTTVWTSLSSLVGEFTKVWDATNADTLENDGIKPGTTDSDNVDAPGSTTYSVLWHVFKITSDTWDWLEGLSDDYQNVVDELGAFFNGVTTSTLEYAKKIVTEIFETGTGIVDEIRAQITSWWNTQADNVYQWLKDLPSAIQQLITHVGTFFGTISWIEAVEEDTTAGTSEITEEQAVAANNALLANKIIGHIFEGATDLTDTLKDWLDTQWANLTSFFDDPVTLITDNASRISTIVDTWWDDITTGVIGRLKDHDTLFSNIATFFGTIDWWEDGDDGDEDEVNIDLIGRIITTNVISIFKDIGILPAAFAQAVDSLLSIDEDSTATGRTGGGDIDMQTYDIRRVDRIFFDSNDAIDITSSYPHIGAQSNVFQFLVPASDSQDQLMYFRTATTIIMTLKKSRIELNRPIALANVAPPLNSDDAIDNGTIWFDGTHVKVQTNSGTKSLSEIGSSAAAPDVNWTSVSSNIVPDGTTYNLGTATNYWNKVNVKFVDIAAAGSVTSPSNGLFWKDSSGNVMVRTGGSSKSLSDIGGGITTVNWGSVTANLLPSVLTLTIGSTAKYWNSVYTKYIQLAVAGTASTTNGTFWIDSSGNVTVRTGGSNKSLSSIGAGITTVNWGSVTANLLPDAVANNRDIGTSTKYWNHVYAKYIQIAAAGTASTTNGVFWIDSSGNVTVRTGGSSKSLSDIGGGITSVNWTSVASNIIPSGATYNLGASATNYWNHVYAKFFQIVTNIGTATAPTTNGTFWMDGTDVKVYSNSGARNLSDIVNIGSIDNNIIPKTDSARDIGSTSKRFRNTWSDNIRLSHFIQITSAWSQVASAVNGGIWRDSSGNIFARSGSVNRNLSHIRNLGSLDTNIIPSGTSRELGSSSAYWNHVYAKFLQIAVAIADDADDPATNGTIWLDGNDLKIYSGGSTRNLSTVGTGITSINWGAVIAHIIPGTDGTYNLGSSAKRFKGLFVDDIQTTNFVKIDGTWTEPTTIDAGTIWKDSNGNIKVKTGTATKSLSDIGTGITSIPWGVVPASIIPSGATYDLGASATNYWNHVYAKFFQIAVAVADDADDPETNGTIWLDGDDIKVRTGSATKSLSTIGTGLTSVNWGSVTANLLPSVLTLTVGSSTKYWNHVYTKFIQLAATGTASTTNGTFWIDSNGNVHVRTGGSSKSLSTIGSGITSIPWTAVASNIIPDAVANTRDLGTSTKYWNNVYTKFIQLAATGTASTTNGAIWIDSDGNINVRTGGSTKSLSGIGAGITSVNWGAVSANLLPDAVSNNRDIGTSTKYWNHIYTKYIQLATTGTASTTNGVFWIDSSGNVYVRTGGNSKSLSNINLATSWTSVASNIIPDAVANTRDLGTSTKYWNHLYAKYIQLAATGTASTTNGTFWIDSNGNVNVRTGGSTKSLSSVGGGITSIPWGAVTANVIPDAVANNRDLGTSAKYWNHIYAKFFQIATAIASTADDPTTNGTIWLDGNDLKVRTGGATKSLSDIGGGITSIPWTAVASNIIPDSAANSRNLGTSAKYWNHVYAKFLQIAASIADDADDPETNGTIWLDGDDVKVHSGGSIKNLSSVGSGITSVPWGSVAANIIPDSVANNRDLGTSAKYWNHIYAKFFQIATSIADDADDPETNGTIWLDGDDLKVYSGGAVKNLTSVGSGITSIPWGAVAANVIPDAVANTRDLGTSAKYWNHIYAKFFQLSKKLASDEDDPGSVGTLWLDNDNNVKVKTGSTTLNLTNALTSIPWTSVASNIIPNGATRNLGSTTTAWNNLFAKFVKLSAGTTSSPSNGTIWLATNDINVRTGGNTRSLSNIRDLTSLNLNLIPDAVANNRTLGTSTKYWNYTYTKYIQISAAHSGTNPTTAGTFWLDSNSNVHVRTGTGSKNLSNISADTTINLGAIGANIIPSTDSTYDLGSSSKRFDDGFIDDLTVTDVLTFSNGISRTRTTNGKMWLDASGHIQVRTGGNTRSLTNIGASAAVTQSDIATWINNGATLSDNIKIAVRRTSTTLGNVTWGTLKSDLNIPEALTDDGIKAALGRAVDTTVSTFRATDKVLIKYGGDIRLVDPATIANIASNITLASNLFVNDYALQDVRSILFTHHNDADESTYNAIWTNPADTDFGYELQSDATAFPQGKARIISISPRNSDRTVHCLCNLAGSARDTEGNDFDNAFGRLDNRGNNQFEQYFNIPFDIRTRSNRVRGVGAPSRTLIVVYELLRTTTGNHASGYYHHMRKFNAATNTSLSSTVYGIAYTSAGSAPETLDGIVCQRNADGNVEFRKYFINPVSGSVTGVFTLDANPLYTDTSGDIPVDMTCNGVGSTALLYVLYATKIKRISAVNGSVAEYDLPANIQNPTGISVFGNNIHLVVGREIRKFNFALQPVDPIPYLRFNTHVDGDFLFYAGPNKRATINTEGIELHVTGNTLTMTGEKTILKSTEVDLFRLKPKEIDSSYRHNGLMWLDTDGHVMVHSGDGDRDLSTIGAEINWNAISANIIPDGTSPYRNLGSPTIPWGNLHVVHHKFIAGPDATGDGIMWLDSSGNVKVNTGGTTKSLTNIGKASFADVDEIQFDGNTETSPLRIFGQVEGGTPVEGLTYNNNYQDMTVENSHIWKLDHTERKIKAWTYDGERDEDVDITPTTAQLTATYGQCLHRRGTLMFMLDNNHIVTWRKSGNTFNFNFRIRIQNPHANIQAISYTGSTLLMVIRSNTGQVTIQRRTYTSRLYAVNSRLPDIFVTDLEDGENLRGAVIVGDNVTLLTVLLDGTARLRTYFISGVLSTLVADTTPHPLNGDPSNLGSANGVLYVGDNTANALFSYTPTMDNGRVTAWTPNVSQTINFDAESGLYGFFAGDNQLQIEVGTISKIISDGTLQINANQLGLQNVSDLTMVSRSDPTTDGSIWLATDGHIKARINSTTVNLTDVYSAIASGIDDLSKMGQTWQTTGDIFGGTIPIHWRDTILVHDYSSGTIRRMEMQVLYRYILNVIFTGGGSAALSDAFDQSSSAFASNGTLADNDKILLRDASVGWSSGGSVRALPLSKLKEYVNA